MPLSLPSSLAQRNPIPYPIDAVTSDPTIPAQLNVYDHDRQNSMVDAAAGTNTTHSLNSNNIPSSQNNNINNNNINNVGSFTDPSMLTCQKCLYIATRSSMILTKTILGPLWRY
ncbi:BBT_HP_G0132060.mRNA.1.CDS.1 [Saccharomyces cerevisiae]|nr:BBT_HP_G0132060.mRNA.1.CDS.1 [Saccharomyces cerevisiae]CAI6975724.1 BBT_HP_G0132060.mRNA.1.CDS.1 [Saccharomyces cerevisiae]